MHSSNDSTEGPRSALIRTNGAVPMFTQTVTRALSGVGLDTKGTGPQPRQPAPMLIQKSGGDVLGRFR